MAPRSIPFADVTGLPYLLGDPRIAHIYRDRVFNFAWEHYEKTIGWDQERKLRQAHHAASKYADRVFAALKDGQPLPPPTAPQLRDGVDQMEAAHIRSIVLDTVDEHLAKIEAALAARSGD